MNDVCRLFDFLAALFVLLTGCLSGYAISYWNRYEYRGPTHDIVDERSSSGKFFNDVKVLCLVMTFSVNHKWKALPVVETWGNLCNRILFVSNATDDELPTLIVDLHESRDDLWLKTRNAFEWIYQNTLDDYDWFLKADDDTYFHMDNLRGFLKNYSPEQPFSIGHLFKVSGMHDTYHSGGAGYILSREALRKLDGKGFTRDANCVQKNEHEDLFMGRCLKSLGIDLIDGADKNGAYRFHPIAIWDLLTNNAPKWLADKSATHLKEEFLCCSSYFISMHYVNGDDQYMVEYALHRLRPYGMEVQL
ncbi:unnamed protein product [Angiostrongylus costaricensis]|uniref:N-acetylgalactosaminide beta-1,3-galactosyltransferase n=1 Tax=Angiostrongylus costaricensis TaxID=334426 RepID=A0A0R3PG39_ANGCS|nr:unnamed protein product [Angiostrongylus costaricensis]